jgi:hypothetical protein
MTRDRHHPDLFRAKGGGFGRVGELGTLVQTGELGELGADDEFVGRLISVRTSPAGRALIDPPASGRLGPAGRRRVLAKLPGEHDIRAIDLAHELQRQPVAPWAARLRITLTRTVPVVMCSRNPPRSAVPSRL